ncbi:MAG: hypothetical protein JSW39_28720 [Desulfobacterales bacterium]|nr:MAG: hypothetical protein JSW39_28720 [Desulfobacterales bacterium]
MLDDKTPPPPKLSMANTKKEMIEAYNVLLKQLKEKKAAELKPAKELEEKRAKEVVETAKSLSTEGVVRDINSLKVEIGGVLAQIADKLENEVKKFETIQKGIEIKEQEFQEIYEIEREASTLAALIETQNRKRAEFESELAAQKEALTREIETTRSEWAQEQKRREVQLKESGAEEKKRREREKEEFDYTFQREQQLALDRFEDEKAARAKELRLKQEQTEKELAEREKAVAAKEAELAELRQKVSQFPQELEAALQRAAQEATARIQADAQSKAELLQKEFGGERNVLTTRIDSLEQTVKQQREQIAKLTQQLEMAYQKVQDIALKALEGSTNIKAFSSLHQLVAEQARKPSADK